MDDRFESPLFGTVRREAVSALADTWAHAEWLVKQFKKENALLSYEASAILHQLGKSIENSKWSAKHLRQKCSCNPEGIDGAALEYGAHAPECDLMAEDRRWKEAIAPKREDS